MKLFPLIFVFAASSAFAETSVMTQPSNENLAQRSMSEVFYFTGTGANHLLLTPKFTTTSKSYSGNISGSSYSKDMTSQAMQISYDYGIRDSDVAIGVRTSTGDDKDEFKKNGNTTDYKFSGQSDFQFVVKKIKQQEGSNFIFGTSIFYSPSDNQIAYANQSGNRVSGGNSLSPFGELEIMTGFGSAGGSLSYRIFGTRTSGGKSGFTDKVDGQNVLALTAFSETQYGIHAAGVTAEYDMTESGSGNDSLSGRYELDAFQSLHLTGYGKYQATRNVTLKPSLAYKTVLTKAINNYTYSKNEEVGASLGVGIVF